MKRLLVVMMIALASLSATAQKFNGTVTYAVDYKGDMVDMLRSMMPNKQVYHYLDGNFRMETLGGMASGQGDVLYTAKDGNSYLISTVSKKAQILPNKKEGESSDKEVAVTETGEKMTILGYECDKYKVVIKSDDTEMVQYVWATKALEPAKPKTSDNALTAALGEKIKGMPLKMELQFEQAGMSFTMIMTASDISNTKPDKNLFIIPKDYTVEEFNPKSLGR